LPNRRVNFHDKHPFGFPSSRGQRNALPLAGFYSTAAANRRRSSGRLCHRRAQAGPGNTEAQFELIEAYRPIGHSGTPDFLKILLDAAASAGRDVSSLKRALVSGAAFPKSLQEEVESRGVEAYQAFGTADFGMIAFETAAREGMVVNEHLILEIVRPGTGDPVAPGDVGEMVVTSLDPRPSLDAARARRPHRGVAGYQPVRAYQSSDQELDGPRRPDHQGQGHVRATRAHRGNRQTPSTSHTLRLVVRREGNADAMTLKAEAVLADSALREAVAATLRAVTKLGGEVEWVEPGSLPNDGKVIVDERGDPLVS
jgi:phenylacetate-CoA ligase